MRSEEAVIVVPARFLRTRDQHIAAGGDQTCAAEHREEAVGERRLPGEPAQEFDAPARQKAARPKHEPERAQEMGGEANDRNRLILVTLHDPLAAGAAASAMRSARIKMRAPPSF